MEGEFGRGHGCAIDAKSRRNRSEATQSHVAGISLPKAAYSPAESESMAQSRCKTLGHTRPYAKIPEVFGLYLDLRLYIPFGRRGHMYIMIKRYSIQ